jgi:hypothetical protein
MLLKIILVSFIFVHSQQHSAVVLATALHCATKVRSCYRYYAGRSNQEMGSLQFHQEATHPPTRLLRLRIGLRELESLQLRLLDCKAYRVQVECRGATRGPGERVKKALQG